MLDPVWKHFGNGLLQPAYSQNWAKLYMPDLTSHIWFGSVLTKKAQIRLCKTGPDPVWMAWSDFGQTCPDNIVQNWPGWPGQILTKHIWSGCYQFPIFRLSCILPQTTQIIQYKANMDPVWFRLTVSGFGQMDPVQKHASVQEWSGLLLASASKLIQIRCELNLECLLGLFI